MNGSSTGRVSEPGRFLGPHYEDDFSLAMVLGRERTEASADAIANPGGPEQARRREQETLSRFFNLPKERIFMLEQVHGTECVFVGEQDPAHNQTVFFGRGDALLTVAPHILLCIRTADCLPVFFFGYKEPRREITAGRTRPALAGIIHAGWRGLHGGVIQAALVSACAAGCRSFRIFRGPCIGGDVYEVGPEVAENFKVKKRNTANRERETWLLDLAGNAGHRLESEDLTIAGPLDQDFRACVYADNDDYYSHRRGDTGRNLNVIMLKAV